VRVVGPGETEAPLAEADGVKLTAIVPPEWPRACADDANECSLGLRIDFRDSSVLFVGDAEHDEEAMLDPGGPVTLLQVAHHGSATSTTPGFLAKVRPRYAVVSAGKPDEGLNASFCHPRALVVKRLTALLGGPGTKTLRAFDGERCENARASDWIDVPVSDRLWATERDGDVILTTAGDGVFRRE
jgi:competence protein ComEC